MWSGNEGKRYYTHIGGGCVVGVYNGDVSCGFDWKVILMLITMFVTLLHMNSISHPTCKTGNFTRSHITCAKGWYEYYMVGPFTAAGFTEARSQCLMSHSV